MSYFPDVGTTEGPGVAEAIFFELLLFYAARGVSGSLRSAVLKERQGVQAGQVYFSRMSGLGYFLAWLK